MVQIEEAKFHTLLKFFFTEFFCDYLEEAIDDKEKSIVTLFRGMNFFFDIIKEYDIEFPYSTIREYITRTYSDGEVIYDKLSDRYDDEIVFYNKNDKSFEEIYGDTIFL